MISKKLLPGLLVLISLFSNIQAQTPGENVFDETMLHEVRIELDQPDYWDILINNYQNTPTGDAVPYIMCNIQFDDEFVDSIGIRLKGFTSFWTASDKKPIKLDFNEFVRGKRLDGLRKLNLNNGTGDPSLQRDVLCYDLLNSVGIPAPRTSYAKVYLNGDYWGLYQVIEQIDKEFLDEHFSSPRGNLFKNKSWNALEWLGNDKEVYKATYELKTNEEEDNWTGFIHLMDFINNTSDEDFEEGLEALFNVDAFLKNLAVDIATNNWDSYMEHGRNWYLYEDTSTSVFHWLPWDYNLALGGSLAPPGNCDLFPDFVGFFDGSPSVQFYDAGFAFNNYDILWDFGDGNTSIEENPLHTYSDPGAYRICITYIQDADCERQFFQQISTFTNQNECASLDNNFPHPIDRTVAIVLDFQTNCCEFWGTDCEDLYNAIKEQDAGNGVQGFNVDLEENSKPFIQRLWNIPRYQDLYYEHFCRMMQLNFVPDKYERFINDNVALIREAVREDPNALYSFDRFESDGGANGLQKYIRERVENIQIQLEELDVCTDIALIRPGDIVINEFMASNDTTSTLTDAYGDHDDWIELFNKSSNTYDLSDVYLSDNPDIPQKWSFPEGTRIEAGEYLIIWADKDEDQEGNHADFRLSKAGESILLSNADGSRIDALDYTEQETNIASARVPNGIGDFIQKSATLGFNNDWLSNIEEIEPSLKFTVFPNPGSSNLTVLLDDQNPSNYSLSLRNANGHLMEIRMINQEESSLDISTLTPGMYYIEVYCSDGSKATQKFIKI